MVRFLATLLAGALRPSPARRCFRALFPNRPSRFKKAAASLGIQEKPAAAPNDLHSKRSALGRRSGRGEKRDGEALQAVAAFRQSGGDPFVAAERAAWLYYLKGAYTEAEQAYTNAARLHSAALNPALGLLNVAEAMKDPKRIRAAAEAVMRMRAAELPRQYGGRQ